MLENIKLFLWFLKYSKKFTGFGYFKMIFKEHGIKRGIYFVKSRNYDRKMIKKYGWDVYYGNMDRCLEINNN